MMKTKRYGATMVEVLISATVFSTVSLALVMLLSYGVRSWKQVESRYDVERDVRRASILLNDDLRNTDIASVNCGDSWLAMKAVYSEEGVNTLQVSSEKTTANEVLWNSYVIYYALKPTPEQLQSLGEPPCGCSSEGGFCPHKILVRRVVTFSDMGIPADGEAGDYLTAQEAAAHTGVFPEHSTGKNMVLARNVIGFSAEFNESYPGTSDGHTVVWNKKRGSDSLPPGMVEYKLECLRALEADSNAGRFVSADSIPKRYVFSIDQLLVPLNSSIVYELPKAQQK